MSSITLKARTFENSSNGKTADLKMQKQLTQSNINGNYIDATRKIKVFLDAGANINHIKNTDRILANDTIAILDSSICLAHFFLSLIYDYSPESLLFYLEAKSYSSRTDMSNKTLKSYARLIWSAFVCRAAVLEINITSTMRSKIFEDLSRETVSPGIFQKAQSHSYRLLESALINFIQKPVYQHMLEDVVELAKYPGRREQLLINITAKITIALWKTYGVRVLSKSRKLDVETIMGNERDFTSSDLRTSLEAWAQRFAFTHLQMPLPTYDSAAVTLGFSMLDTHKQKTSPASLNLRGSEPYLGSSVFATTETLTIPTHKIDGSTEQCEKNEKKNTDESGGKWFKKASIPFGSRWLNRFSKKS